MQQFFSASEKEEIVSAIRRSEEHTSAEIRLFLDDKCPGNVLDQAAYVFSKLGMHKTKQRNGVLFYLAVSDHKFAVIGDAGINSVVPVGFWDEIKDAMEADFREKKFVKGLVTGIRMAGEALAKEFPKAAGDINELSNEIAFGEKR
jgi:uncharacterized membrane protein